MTLTNGICRYLYTYWILTTCIMCHLCYIKCSFILSRFPARHTHASNTYAARAAIYLGFKPQKYENKLGSRLGIRAQGIFPHIDAIILEDVRHVASTWWRSQHLRTELEAFLTNFSLAAPIIYLCTSSSGPPTYLTTCRQQPAGSLSTLVASNTALNTLGDTPCQGCAGRSTSLPRWTYVTETR